MIKFTFMFSHDDNHDYIFLIYIKISKDSSAKYYQNNKERLQTKKIKKKATIWL